jgi:hypothetical protein
MQIDSLAPLRPSNQENSHFASALNAAHDLSTQNMRGPLVTRLVGNMHITYPFQENAGYQKTPKYIQLNTEMNTFSSTAYEKLDSFNSTFDRSFLQPAYDNFIDAMKKAQKIVETTGSKADIDLANQFYDKALEATLKASYVTDLKNGKVFYDEKSKSIEYIDGLALMEKVSPEIFE